MHTSELMNVFKKRIAELKQMPTIRENTSIKHVMKDHNVSRRDFLKWAASVTAMLALPSEFVPVVAQAAEVADRVPLIWLHMAECTGCSESLLRTDAPSIDALIFNYISLEYHETLMVASGYQAEQNLENAIKKYKDKYVLMVEGAIPTRDDGHYLTFGASAKTAKECAIEAVDNAAAIFAIGTCSAYGGVQAAAPNPSQSVPLSKITNKFVINVPGCPPSEKNIVGTLMYYILYGALPAVDAYNRPKWAYSLRIHDLCERRGHFDAGEFVEQFGDENAKNGFCLYKVGCKGPYTFNNCAKNRFNQHTSWPVQAGHGCIGCSEPNFWDTMVPLEEPVADRLFDAAFAGLGADATADKIGITLLGATAVGIAVHAAISSVNPPKE